MQPMSSAITGVLEQAATRASSTGHSRSETGSANSLAVSESEARGWLSRQTSPEDVDRALVRSLTSSLGQEPRMVREGRYPEGAPAYSVVVACQVEASSQLAVNAAIGRVEAATTPAEPEQVRRWIAALSVATRGARGSETDALAALELYSGALLRYPADVAKAACTMLAEDVA